MKGKKIIAIVLVLIFSIPLLPISQVGSFLSSNQLQEEVVHATIHKEVTSQENDFIHTLALWTETSKRPIVLPCDEQIRSRQADDIQTPPPNA